MENQGLLVTSMSFWVTTTFRNVGDYRCRDMVPVQEVFNIQQRRSKDLEIRNRKISWPLRESSLH
jgi:hypothetical protein